MKDLTYANGISTPQRVGQAAAVLLLLLLNCPANCGPQVSQFRNDTRRTGRTSYEITKQPQFVWSFSAPATSVASPVIADNGTVYYGSYDKRMYAVSTKGALIWSFPSNGTISSTAAIGADGSVYFTTSAGSLYSIGSNGVQKWAVALQPYGNPSSSAPLVTSNNIFLGSDNKYVYCLKPDGSVNWSYLTGGAVKYGLSTSPDGSVVYAPSADGRIYALDAVNGTLKWKSALVSPGNVCAVGNDGAIYVGGTDSYLYSISPNGTTNWRRSAMGKITAAPAIGLDGTIYFGAQDSTMYAVDTTGSLKWMINTSSSIISSPTIDPYGTLIFGTYGGNLTAVNTTDGSKLWERSISGNYYLSPVVGSGGNVFVTDSSGRLSNYVGPFQSVPEPSSILVLAWSLGACTGFMRSRRGRRAKN